MKIASVREPSTIVARDISLLASPKISSLIKGHGARKSDDPERSQKTVTDREELKTFVLTDDGVSGTTVYEPRSVGDVGLERDLVATADQSLSSNR